VLGHDHSAGALGIWSVPALDACALLTEPAEELPAVGDLTARFVEGFAHLQGHQEREVLFALLQQIERATQQLTTLPGGGRRPPGGPGGRRVERLHPILR